MPAFKFPRFIRLARALALAACLGQAQAAELGDPVVRSYRGQALAADIELVGLVDPAAPVQARLAHGDVYRGANIAMSPVLSSVNLSVMRRDGKQFLHVTSTRPVEADFLHVYVDLSESGRHEVRQVTLWFAPEPPRPVQAAVPVPAPVPVPEKPAPTVEEKPARREAPPARLALAAPVAAACPQPSADQLRTCATLDYKNGLLSARIVELEEKVKVLQRAVEASTVPAPQALPAPTPPRPAIKRAEKKKTAAKWPLVAGGLAVLALIGAGVALVLRRRKGKGTKPVQASEPGRMAKLKARFKRDKSAVKVEPEAVQSPEP